MGLSEEVKEVLKHAGQDLNASQDKRDDLIVRVMQEMNHSKSDERVKRILHELIDML